MAVEEPESPAAERAYPRTMTHQELKTLRNHERSRVTQEVRGVAPRLNPLSPPLASRWDDGEPRVGPQLAIRCSPSFTPSSSPPPAENTSPSLSPGKRLHHQRSSRHAMVPLSDTSPHPEGPLALSRNAETRFACLAEQRPHRAVAQARRLSPFDSDPPEEERQRGASAECALTMRRVPSMVAEESEPAVRRSSSVEVPAEPTLAAAELHVGSASAADMVVRVLSSSSSGVRRTRSELPAASLAPRRHASAENNV
jgi:hypothetical protein